jgi:hypothetical protein
MHFPDMAMQAFAFLERAGFRLTRRDPACLEYETPQTFVTIEWDSRIGELNAHIGLRSKKGQAGAAFSLTDLLSMEQIELPARTMPPQISEESRLKPFLDRLADDMRVYAQSALAGNPMFFRRMEVFRSKQAQRYARDVQLRRVRAEAGKAWQQRDLIRLAELYSSIKDQLTASEKAKLAYAKKQQTS